MKDIERNTPHFLLTPKLVFKKFKLVFFLLIAALVISLFADSYISQMIVSLVNNPSPNMNYSKDASVIAEGLGSFGVGYSFIVPLVLTMLVGIFAILSTVTAIVRATLLPDTVNDPEEYVFPLKFLTTPALHNKQELTSYAERYLKPVRRPTKKDYQIAHKIKRDAGIKASA